jgi:uncharacterized zinc-type alcohol dehydrogenase-like protein
VPESFDVNPFLNLLDVDGTMVNVGHYGPMTGGFNNAGLNLGCRSLAGSNAGGIAEMQNLINHCAESPIPQKGHSSRDFDL